MSPRQPNDAPTPAEVPHLLGESPFPSGDNSTSRWSQQTLFDPNVSQPFQPEPEGILDFRKHPSHSFLSQRDRSKVTSGEPHAHIVDRFQAPQFNHRRILLRTRTPYQLSPPPFFNSPEIFHKGRPFYVDAHGQKHLDESRQFLWEDPTSPETDNGYGRPAKVVPDSALQTSHHTRNDGHQTKSDCSIRMELHLESETPLRRDGATKAVASASAVERTPQPSQHRSWDSRISMQTRLSVTNTKYCLIIRQQPEKCRGSGFGGEKTDRRPIDPSVIVQLCTVLPNGDLEASLSALGPVEAFVAHAVLLSADGSEDRSLVLVPRVSIPLDAINSGALTIAAHEPNASHQYRGRPDDENRRVIDTNGTTESSFMDSVDDRPSLESAGPEDATRNANAVPPSTLRLSSSKAIDGLYSNTLTEIDLISIPTDAEPGPAPPKHPLRLGSQDFEYDTHVRAANEEYELASNGARGYDVRDVATAACFRKVDFDGDKGDHSLDDMVERGGTTATGPCGKYRYRSLPLDSEVDENQQHYLHQDRHGWNHVAIGRGAITRVVDPSIEETIDSLNDNRGLTRGLQRDCVGSSGGSAEGTGREGMNLDEGHQTNKPLFGSSQHAEADKVLTKAATPSDTADSFAAGAVSVDGHSSGTPGSGGVETSGANPVDRQNNGGGPEVMTDQSADRSSIEASGDSPASGASKGSDTRAVGGAPRGCPEHSTRKRRCWRCSNESGSDCSSNCAVSNASGQLRAAPTPRKGIGPPSRSSNDSKGQTRRHSLSEHKFRLGTHQNANNHFHSTRRDWPRRRSWDASTSTEPRTILPKAGGDRKSGHKTFGSRNHLESDLRNRSQSGADDDRPLVTCSGSLSSSSTFHRHNRTKRRLPQSLLIGNTVEIRRRSGEQTLAVSPPQHSAPPPPLSTSQITFVPSTLASPLPVSAPPWSTLPSDDPAIATRNLFAAPTPQRSERTLFGSLVSPCQFLTDLTGVKGAYFVFPELCVRVEGTFRLKIVVSDLSSVGMALVGVGPARTIATTITQPFVCLTAKEWTGAQESSDLSKHFSDQGIKIPIRRKSRKKE